MTTARKAVLVVGVLTLVSGAFRFAGLGQPSEKVFDEVYYASDGCWYAGHPYRDCGLESDSERSWVHPPLGKQSIALGIDVFGNRPFGWRVTAALAGTATVGLIGILAFLLFGSPLWAGIATLLAGTEHLLFVQSRIAMLDVFLAFFVVLGFVFLAADRRRDPPSAADVQRLGFEGPAGPRHEARSRRGWIRPWYLAAGAAFGAAMAVKWSGYLALLGGVTLAVVWTVRRVMDRSTRNTEFAGLAVSFAAVPFLVYALTWIPWLADRSFDVGEWFRHHGDMWDYHYNLETVKDNGEPIHPYMSKAWSWLLLLRPVAYYWQGEPGCCEEIIGIGNPLVFWSALLVIPYLALTWINRRQWQAGVVLIPILVQFLPWLIVSRPLFLFYMTPVTPFLALGLVFPIRDLLRTRLPRPLAVAGAAVVVAVSVATFAFFLPVLTGDRISYEAWESRIWFSGWV
jgi:dolichyl-phosphate-mannose--protein O-mannosyl transferase